MTSFSINCYMSYFIEGAGSPAVCGVTEVVVTDEGAGRPKDFFELKRAKEVDGRLVGGACDEGQLAVLVKVLDQYEFRFPAELNIYIANGVSPKGKAYGNSNFARAMEKVKKVVEQVGRREKNKVRDHMVSCAILRRPKTGKKATKPKCYDTMVKLIDMILDANYPDVHLTINLIEVRNYKVIPELIAIGNACQGLWTDVMEKDSSNIIPIRPDPVLAP